MPISFDGEIPRYESARVWTPPPGDSKALVLADPVCVWIHWMGKRTLPCYGDDCPKSRHRRPVRWVAYLPVAVHDGRKTFPAVLPMTAEKMDKVSHCEHGPPGPLLMIHRKEKSREWTIKNMDDKPYKKSNLPNTPQVKLILARLWGINPNELDSDTKGTEDYD